MPLSLTGYSSPRLCCQKSPLRRTGVRRLRKSLWFGKAIPFLAVKLTVTGIHVALGAKRIAGAGYRVATRHGDALAGTGDAAGDIVFPFESALGQVNTEHAARARALLPACPKTVQWRADYCPQAAESILQCVKRDCSPRKGRKRLQNRSQRDLHRIDESVLRGPCEPQPDE